MKIAIVTTHPIQYNAPWFRILAQQPGISVKVFYTWSQSEQGPKFDPGFGKVITWDIPLLEGYEYEFVENIAKDHGTHHFRGIDNPGLNNKIKEWQPDALLVMGWSFKSHFKAMRFFKRKIPILFRGDSTLLNEQPGIKKLLRRMFLSFVYSYADIALYVGENNKQYFLAHGLRETQLYFAPHAIDNDRFSVHAELYNNKAKHWRKELGIEEDDFVILFAGKLEPVKDPKYILRLANALPEDNLRFIIIGNGPMESQLKTQAEKDKRVIFIDFQNQQTMPIVYRLCNVFLLSSKSETWGLAVNEAMACGRPVIVSSQCGCAIDLITDETGIIFSPGDIEKSINYIRALINDKTKAYTASASALKKINAFSFAGIVNTIAFIMNNDKIFKVRSIRNN